MKTSEIMTDDVIALTSDDTTGKALNIMYEKKD
jgi:predicted transcriptional regulator